MVGESNREILFEELQKQLIKRIQYSIQLQSLKAGSRPGTLQENA